MLFFIFLPLGAFAQQSNNLKIVFEEGSSNLSSEAKLQIKEFLEAEKAGEIIISPPGFRHSEDSLTNWKSHQKAWDRQNETINYMIDSCNFNRQNISFGSPPYTIINTLVIRKNGRLNIAPPFPQTIRTNMHVEKLGDLLKEEKFIEGANGWGGYTGCKNPKERAAYALNIDECIKKLIRQIEKNEPEAILSKTISTYEKNFELLIDEYRGETDESEINLMYFDRIKKLAIEKEELKMKKF